MSLSNTNNKDIYTADGIRVDWDFTFDPIVSDGSDIQVIVTDLAGADTTITSNFTVNLTTKKVTYPSVVSGLPPVLSGYKVTLYRVEQYTQIVDLKNQGSFNAQVIESAFDKLTAICQQVKETLSRTIQYPISTTPASISPDPFLTTVLAAQTAAQTAATAAAASNTSASTQATNSAASAAAAAASAASIAGVAGVFKTATVSIKTTNYTLVSGDFGKLMMMNSGSAQAFTMPAIAGNEVAIISNIGAGALTITPAGGNTTDKTTLAQNETIILCGDLTNTKWRVVAGWKTMPSGAIVGTTDTQVLTNKRITGRAFTTTSTATLTPELDTYDAFSLTAQAATLTIANPSTTTPAHGDVMIIDIIDNGTARAVSFGTAYVAKAGVALPTTTVLSKKMTLGFRYDAGLAKWNLLALGQEV